MNKNLWLVIQKMIIFANVKRILRLFLTDDMSFGMKVCFRKLEI